MSPLLIPFRDIVPEDRGRVGGKGYVLASLSRNGFPVPPGFCLPAEFYDRYVAATGLRERIMMELNRKELGEMRWEEIWDAAFRIRNFFSRTGLPPEMEGELKKELGALFRGRPVMVRSSAPGEDSGRTSYAGLHDSFSARSVEEIIEKIVLVWASLWSDRALLYRKEIALDSGDGAIAVVIQEVVAGEVSGVGFGVNPNNDDQAVIESVWGLNRGLVDGTIPPDRWILDRRTGRVISHDEAVRKEELAIEDGVTALRPLEADRRAAPPLDGPSLKKVFSLIAPLEDFLGFPPDFEWTIGKGELFLLQARPITIGAGEERGGGKMWERGDRRPWYLSLSRSFENLKVLREKIEGKLIPEMARQARRLAGIDLDILSDEGLAGEIEERRRITARWREIYWSEFIPFAHGIRLFGQVYNDAVHPRDPYEFMSLLGAGETESISRNRLLGKMASLIRRDEGLRDALQEGRAGSGSQFEKLLKEFMEKYGELSCGISQCAAGREGIVSILLKMAAVPEMERRARRLKPDDLLKDFLDKFSGLEKKKAREILELGRAGYRLRDDDNIHLARIEGQLLRALEEGRKRIAGDSPGREPSAEDIAGRLRGEEREYGREEKAEGKSVTPSPRQLIGQPAGPGFARGPARVIREAGDLFKMEKGEVLVVDAVEPEMTFVVPLAAAIVERRGGMLIHGAIIAREYGLPCVTGIPEASEVISTGEDITVDGYLGKVIINR